MMESGGTVLNSWSRQEEDLCDQGAAELLISTSRLHRRLSSAPAAMIVLEPSLKPADLTHITRRQSQRTLPRLPHEDPITPRLRVQKCLGHKLPYIPRYKSIDDSTPLADVLSNGTADYVGETGLVPGHFRVSARLLPIRRDGVLVNRVVALLFDTDGGRHYGGVRQSG